MYLVHVDLLFGNVENTLAPPGLLQRLVDHPERLQQGHLLQRLLQRLLLRLVLLLLRLVLHLDHRGLLDLRELLLRLVLQQDLAHRGLLAPPGRVGLQPSPAATRTTSMTPHPKAVRKTIVASSPIHTTARPVLGRRMQCQMSEATTIQELALLTTTFSIGATDPLKNQP